MRDGKDRKTKIIESANDIVGVERMVPTWKPKTTGITKRNGRRDRRTEEMEMPKQGRTRQEYRYSFFYSRS